MTERELPERYSWHRFTSLLPTYGQRLREFLPSLRETVKFAGDMVLDMIPYSIMGAAWTVNLSKITEVYNPHLAAAIFGLIALPASIYAIAEFRMLLNRNFGVPTKFI